MNSPQHPTASPTAGRRLMPSNEFKRVLGGMSEMTRWRHEKARIGPIPIKVGGRNFYFQDEVLAYLDHLAATRQQIPDEQSADPADDENLCLAERIAANE